MSELSITPSPNLDNLQRRKIARNELENIPGLGILMYLMHSPHVRKGTMPNGKTGYALIDVLNIITESKNEIRFLWRDTKEALLRDKPQLCDEITQLKLPSWDNGKLYKTDVIDKGWLFWFIGYFNTPIAIKFQTAIANALNEFPEEHHSAIIAELEREVGWAGTRIRLEMQSIYEDGDYDNAIQPPGCPE